MKLTNYHRLPNHIYLKILEDINRDPYQNQSSHPLFRVTELLKAPLPLTLERQYKATDAFEVDAHFYLPMLFGTAVHALLEGTDTEDIQFETKTTKEISIADVGNVIVAGTVDEFNSKDCIVTDNKTSQTFSAAHPVDEDYQWQVNIYAYLLGILPHCKLFIRYFYKDWAASKASYTADYPDSMIQERAVLTKSIEEVEDYLYSRIVDHLCSPNRPCTDAERSFGKGITFAVMGPNKARALRVFDNMHDAMEYAERLQRQKKPCNIVERADDSRCRLYCESKSVCPYAQSKHY